MRSPAFVGRCRCIAPGLLKDADGHHTCTHVVPSATNDARLSAASVVRADPPLSRTAIRLAPVDAAVRMTVTSMPRVAAGRFTLRAVVSGVRSEEHTSELQSLMRISYAVFCLKKTKQKNRQP